MAQILCLANSYKGRGQRCIAGIDMDIKEWVRPIDPRGHEGAIGEARLIDGAEPRLLDVLEVPLGGESDAHGCQPENRVLLPGWWKKVGMVSPEDALSYVEDDEFLLHNFDKTVDAEYFKVIPQERWKSLQLIYSGEVAFCPDRYDGSRWRVCFSYGGGCYDLKLTDTVVSERLTGGEKVSGECILTVSLAAPWKPDEETPERCYKMVAGVIEL